MFLSVTLPHRVVVVRICFLLLWKWLLVYRRFRVRMRLLLVYLWTGVEGNLWRV
jgi:hypothetical protein